MRARVAVLAFLALLAAGCSKRERSNPFDPLNPSTNGRPSGFVALAGDRQVNLRWDRVTNSTFTGFQIFRRAPGETGFQPLTDVLGTLNTSFRDVSVVNGGDYDYRLYFVFPFGLGSTPSEQLAAPGPASPWIIEANGNDIIRLTPDNRHVSSRRSGFGETVDLGVNPTNGDVWVADANSGRVVIYEGPSGVTVSVPGFNTPNAIGVDPADGTAWVCDAGRGYVYHLNRDGGFQPQTIGPVDQPADAAVDPGPGYVWVCERGANQVSRYDFSALQWSCAVAAPSRVAVDSITHEGWVTSFASGTVTHVSAGGQVIDALTGYSAPLGVVVDSRRGRVWIADPHAARITALHRDGQEEFHVQGLTDVGELAVDPTTGEAWAVLGSTGSVARISPGGVILRVQGGFQFPYAIGVDPGGR